MKNSLSLYLEKVNFSIENKFIMKKSVLTLLALIFIVSCNKVDKNSEKNIAIVEQYINAVENLDSEGMDDLLANDYIGYGPSHNNEINKEDAIKNWKDISSTLYKSIKYNTSRNIAVSIPDGENKGEWVTNWAELTIVYKKDNAQVTIWANTLYQIKEDKIVKSYTIYNEADALRQLGYEFYNTNE